MFPSSALIAAISCACIIAVHGEAGQSKAFVYKPKLRSDYYATIGCSSPDCLELGEVNECQDLSKCPYSYNNTMTDYVSGTDVKISDGLISFMETQLPLYVETVTSHYPPETVDSADVFNGVGGRAYMFLRMYERSADGDEFKEQYLTTAQSYIETSLANINKISSDFVGFLWGSTGVYTLAAVLATLRGDDETATLMISKVQAIFDSAAVDDSFAPYDDFDSGRAGLIYAATFLNKFYEKDDVITVDSVNAVGLAVVRRGKQLSAQPDQYLEWISPNDGGKWLGQSHGSAGVLCQLLDVPYLLQEGSETRSLIIGTLNHLVDNQFASGNFPSEYYDVTEDVLVQWDHGAPGVLGALSKASIVLNNATYMDSAKLAADCVWDRGILYKGLMLCHGITGNTYMQAYMYKMTGDEKYMYRALQFQEFVSQTPDLYDLDLMRKPTPSPFMFYAASYESAIMLWSDLLAIKESNDFYSLSMPGYEALI